MTIFGKTVKGMVGLAASGADLIVTKSAQGIENKFGENEIVKTASEIGSSTVRVTEITVKTLTDVVDGGLEAGLGYLSKDEDKKNKGWEQSKTAGKEMVTGVGKGIAYTAVAGVVTATSAFTAGKYLVQGEKDLARQEFNQTKGYAKHLGKTVVVGLLAVGPPPEALNQEPENNGSLPQDKPSKKPEEKDQQ